MLIHSTIRGNRRFTEYVTGHFGGEKPCNKLPANVKTFRRK